MKKLGLLLICLFLTLTLTAAAQPPAAPRGTTLFGPSTAAGVMPGEAYVMGDHAQISVTLKASAGADTCSYVLETANDRRGPWTAQPGTLQCTTAAQQRTIQSAWVRVRLTSITGTAPVYVTLAVPHS